MEVVAAIKDRPVGELMPAAGTPAVSSIIVPVAQCLSLALKHNPVRTDATG